MSQLGPGGQEPGRIVSAQITVMPSGDVAELVTDSRAGAWAHWLTKSPGTWSEWRQVAQKVDAVAIDGPFGTGGEAALITVISSSRGRSWFLLTASGLVVIGL